MDIPQNHEWLKILASAGPGLFAGLIKDGIALGIFDAAVVERYRRLEDATCDKLFFAGTGQLTREEDPLWWRTRTKVWLRRIPSVRPIVFSADFFGDESKRRQWNGFNSKNKLYIESVPLKTVVGEIVQFVMPLVRGVAANGSWTRAWNPGGPWQ